MLVLMEFTSGYDGDMYVEVINGQYTARWYELDGTEYTFLENHTYLFQLKDENPPIPSWYQEPESI